MSRWWQVSFKISVLKGFFGVPKRFRPRVGADRRGSNRYVLKGFVGPKRFCPRLSDDKQASTKGLERILGPRALSPASRWWQASFKMIYVLKEFFWAPQAFSPASRWWQASFQTEGCPERIFGSPSVFARESVMTCELQNKYVLKGFLGPQEFSPASRWWQARFKNYILNGFVDLKRFRPRLGDDKQASTKGVLKGFFRSPSVFARESVMTGGEFQNERCERIFLGGSQVFSPTSQWWQADFKLKDVLKGFLVPQAFYPRVDDDKWNFNIRDFIESICFLLYPQALSPKSVGDDRWSFNIRNIFDKDFWRPKTFSPARRWWQAGFTIKAVLKGFLGPQAFSPTSRWWQAGCMVS